jgi:hypothetical protein
MNDLHHPAMPAEFKEFSQHPCLLPGESRREFETIRRMIIDDIRPGTNIEWLWTWTSWTCPGKSSATVAPARKIEDWQQGFAANSREKGRYRVLELPTFGEEIGRSM